MTGDGRITRRLRVREPPDDQLAQCGQELTIHYSIGLPQSCHCLVSYPAGNEAKDALQGSWARA
jgi:hypothetical protein